MYRAVSALEEGLLAAAPADLGFDARAAAEQRAPAVSVSQDGNGTGTNDRALYPEAAVEIEEGVHKLETLLGAVVDRNFDKTEIYILRNILSVPEELVRWVRLSGYEVCFAVRCRLCNVAVTPEDQSGEIASKRE